jgi:hypothetical protein
MCYFECVIFWCRDFEVGIVDIRGSSALVSSKANIFLFSDYSIPALDNGKSFPWDKAAEA